MNEFRRFLNLKPFTTFEGIKIWKSLVISDTDPYCLISGRMEPRSCHRQRCSNALWTHREPRTFSGFACWSFQTIAKWERTRTWLHHLTSYPFWCWYVFPMSTTSSSHRELISICILLTVALVRGDRFYTVDYNSATLTNWGYQDVQPDVDGGSYGGMIGKVW